MPPQESAPVRKLGKFEGSRMVVSQSWALLKEDREILLFPIISSFVSLLVLIIVLAVFFFVHLGGDFSAIDSLDKTNSDYTNYAFLLVYYLVSFFILNFFQAGIYSIAHARFNGEDMTFAGGIKSAMSNVGKIFVWSLVSATVGVILRLIADKFKQAGQIIAAIFGAAWNILTYFSLPSLIIGQSTIIGSFRESAMIIRKTWGETIIVNLGVGFFFGLLALAGIVIMILAIIVAPYAVVLVPLVILLVVYLVGLGVISSALSSIFKLALYEYAKTGMVPSVFSADVIQGAITVKQ